ncbi:hypothetical protein GYMLUDRAFT_65470 [Collybiopsis luxurians FD-317 M1]|uniref:Uncharacterized protein n=1 Tax=Collybiopsis luxurians FD-317 M1 TaxID=944289 RepID=A0A0D0BKJ7_9AGAR|nr:hypothetical protein GYMLUDRAFT_65470 [Collybiopsis luxurians FD-317 M1]
MSEPPMQGEHQKSDPDPPVPPNGQPETKVRAPKESCPVYGWWKQSLTAEEKNTARAAKKRAKCAQEVAGIQVESSGRGRLNTLHHAPIKFAWMENSNSEYQDVKNKHVAIAKAFVQEFGRNLPIPQDPDPRIDYTPYSLHEYPVHEQAAEQEARKQYDHSVYLFVGQWLGSRFRKKEDSTCQEIVNDLLGGKGKGKKKTKNVSDHAQEWGKCHWEEHREQFYRNRSTDAKETTRLAELRVFRQEKWDELPQDQKDGFMAELDAEYKELQESNKATNDKAKRAANAWANRKQILPFFSDLLAKNFNMACIIHLAGPVEEEDWAIKQTLPEQKNDVVRLQRENSKSDPDPRIDYTPYSLHEYPVHEQAAEQEARKQYDHSVYLFVGQWLGSRFGKKEDSTCQEIVNDLLGGKGKGKKKTKNMSDHAQEWGKRHWEEHWEQFYRNRSTDAKETTCLAELHVFRQEKWDELPQDQKDGFMAELDAEYKELQESNKATNDKAKRAANAWANRKQILPFFSDLLAKNFNMACIIHLAGPVEEEDWAIKQTFCESCCDLPDQNKKMMLSDYSEKTARAFGSKYKKFAATLFPDDFCQFVKPGFSSNHDQDELDKPETDNPGQTQTQSATSGDGHNLSGTQSLTAINSPSTARQAPIKTSAGPVSTQPETPQSNDSPSNQSNPQPVGLDTSTSPQAAVSAQTDKSQLDDLQQSSQLYSNLQADSQTQTGVPNMSTSPETSFPLPNPQAYPQTGGLDISAPPVTSFTSPPGAADSSTNPLNDNWLGFDESTFCGNSQTFDGENMESSLAASDLIKEVIACPAPVGNQYDQNVYFGNQYNQHVYVGNQYNQNAFVGNQSIQNAYPAFAGDQYNQEMFPAPAKNHYNQLASGEYAPSHTYQGGNDGLSAYPPGSYPQAGFYNQLGQGLAYDQGWNSGSSESHMAWTLHAAPAANGCSIHFTSSHSDSSLSSALSPTNTSTTPSPNNTSSVRFTPNHSGSSLSLALSPAHTQTTASTSNASSVHFAAGFHDSSAAVNGGSTVEQKEGEDINFPANGDSRADRDEGGDGDKDGGTNGDGDGANDQDDDYAQETDSVDPKPTGLKRKLLDVAPAVDVHVGRPERKKTKRIPEGMVSTLEVVQDKARMGSRKMNSAKRQAAKASETTSPLKRNRINTPKGSRAA